MMTRRRGGGEREVCVPESPDNKRRRGSGKSKEKQKTPVKGEEEQEEEEYIEIPPPRRGRPRKGDSKTSRSEVGCISVPVGEDDDEEVVCKMCQTGMTRRKFKAHNMTNHSNVAQTVDDELVPNRRYYEKRLKEWAKFKKVKTFTCPVPGCSSAVGGSTKSSYKSSLGLAYHLETCGKTRDELEKCMVACEICGRKYTHLNLNMHKRLTHVPRVLEADDVIRRQSDIPRLSGGSRKSAVKARESFKEAMEETEESNGTKGPSTSKRKRKDNKRSKDKDGESFVEEQDEGVPTQPKNDFCTHAAEFLTSADNSKIGSFWSRVIRISCDPFQTVATNPLTRIQKNELAAYLLTGRKESISFKSQYYGILGEDERDFRRLPWLESEILDNEDGHLVHNCGGSIFSLDWHPSGKLLAVATGSAYGEDVNLKVLKNHKSCVIIYSHQLQNIRNNVTPIHWVTPQLIICTDYGYATQVQWGNYFPECWDTYDPDSVRFSHSQSFERIGHLSCSFQDGSIRIFCVCVADLDMPGTFQPGVGSPTLCAYRKASEICLRLDATTHPNAGQVCKFDWHEENKLLVAGYCSGLIAVFDTQTTSPLLTEEEQEGTGSVKVINPFWSFQGHLLPVTGVSFDPMASRYFITGSKDRHLKLWDLHLKQEVENKRVGLIHDICWIRGFIHVAVSFDGAITNASGGAIPNLIRFCQLGMGQSRPTCVESLNVSTLSFYEGITLQGAESGSVTATYFDNYWRECDYERNKRKFNLVNIVKTDLDTSNCSTIGNEDFIISEVHGEQVLKMDEPKLILRFTKERAKMQFPDPTPEFLENYVRFLPFTRINKIAWNPLGNCFAAGYRCGLLLIVPADFKKLYR